MTDKAVPAGYRCPFCPSHADDEFVWHDLAETYVCLGCQAEIDCGFDFELQPNVDDYNCADTIERLLLHLGIDYAEAKRRHHVLVENGALNGKYTVVHI